MAHVALSQSWNRDWSYRFWGKSSSTSWDAPCMVEELGFTILSARRKRTKHGKQQHSTGRKTRQMRMGKLRKSMLMRNMAWPSWSTWGALCTHAELSLRKKKLDPCTTQTSADTSSTKPKSRLNWRNDRMVSFSARTTYSTASGDHIKTSWAHLSRASTWTHMRREKTVSDSVQFSAGNWASTASAATTWGRSVVVRNTRLRGELVLLDHVMLLRIALSRTLPALFSGAGTRGEGAASGGEGWGSSGAFSLELWLLSPPPGEKIKGVGGISGESMRKRQVRERRRQLKLCKSHHMRALTHALESLRSVAKANDFGQLGRDLTVSTGEVMSGVVAGSCGLYHTLLVDGQGTLFSFGKGGGGRLGNGTEEDVFFPHPSFRLDANELVSLSSGSMHNALVTRGGEVYSWGFDSHGQAGCKGGGLMHDEDRNVLRPTRVLGCDSVRFKQVSCGGFHTLACDEAGEVYAWGRSDFGRCGAIPPRADSLSHLEDNAELPIWQPELIPSVSQISSLTSGAFFSLLVDHTRTEMFSFGGNENGELGSGKRSKYEVKPQRVKLPLLVGETVSATASGGFHSAVLTSKGRVLVFGSNKNNQLGLGDKMAKTPVPLELKLAARATQVACGPKYTLVATERQELWMFGNGTGPELVHASAHGAIALPPQQGLHHLLFLEG